MEDLLPLRVPLVSRVAVKCHETLRANQSGRLLKWGTFSSRSGLSKELRNDRSARVHDNTLPSPTATSTAREIFKQILSDRKKETPLGGCLLSLTFRH